jgi:putative transposase
VRFRLDRHAISTSLLVALGVRADWQDAAGDPEHQLGSKAVWRALLDDLVKRGLRLPELVIADGAPGLKQAFAALWSDAPVQRCTVHYAERRIMPRPNWPGRR